MRGWKVEERKSVTQDVSKPNECVSREVNKEMDCVPFHRASHPSPRKRPIRFIIPQTPSALPTGIMYSGRVLSSSTDRRMT
jgi:hypothetical protein